MMDEHQDQLQMQGIDPLQGKCFEVQKRDGRIEEFNEARIFLAIESAFKAHHEIDSDASLPEHAKAAVRNCTELVIKRVLVRAVNGQELEVEAIQNIVEEQLMLAGHVEVARRYILYRERRRLARAQREGRTELAEFGPAAACSIPAEFGPILPELARIYREALPRQHEGETFEEMYRRQFDGSLDEGWRRLSLKLLEFDFGWLARALRPERDLEFSGARLEASGERYLLRENGRFLETPQYFWMRAAMGLALQEGARREDHTLDFYEALSTFRFIPSDLILSQAGFRRPALAAGSESHLSSRWMEPWRNDFLETLDFKRPLVPDLFMKRVIEQGSWSMFDPLEASDLGGCGGGEFEKRYLAYEQKAGQGAMRSVKRMKAVDLWQRIVASVAQTGQAWLGFKDAMHLRSQLSRNESSAGPCGAINLTAHILDLDGGLDVALLRATVNAAVRMLDNAVDLSAYPTEQARLNAMEHRAMGLGMTGLQEALDRLGLNYQSAQAVDFAESSMELISHCAIAASAELARERGSFPGYAESKWSEGVLPIDTLARLAQERARPVDVPAEISQDWASARDLIRCYGMRNCALIAITSLETPARIAGVTPSIDLAIPGAETDPAWCIEHAARRQKWIDTAQTLTFRTSERDLGQLGGRYLQAWEKGIKTIHHLCLAAPHHVEPKAAEARVMAESPA